MTSKTAPAPTDETDLSTWIERARRGQRVALDHLCRHFEPAVRAQVGRNMGPRARRWDDSASLTNLVLAEVLRGLERPGDRRDPIDERELRRRLRYTANSRVIDHVRAHRFELGESASLLPVLDVRAADPTDRVVARRDLKHRLARSIAALPPLYVEIFRLRHQDDLSEAEIAIELGLRKDTVRKRLARGYRLLSQRLATIC
ncbi:MAG: sigma-70 family RNA polymerase sigma factor [bacterium]|nr:sigma-70 family RNA polymerase sigma factor [bacterium]